jgi:hypothetical protein
MIAHSSGEKLTAPTAVSWRALSGVAARPIPPEEIASVTAISDKQPNHAVDFRMPHLRATSLRLERLSTR